MAELCRREEWAFSPVWHEPTVPAPGVVVLCLQCMDVTLRVSQPPLVLPLVLPLLPLVPLVPLRPLLLGAADGPTPIPIASVHPPLAHTPLMLAIAITATTNTPTTAALLVPPLHTVLSLSLLRQPPRCPSLVFDTAVRSRQPDCR